MVGLPVFGGIGAAFLGLLVVRDKPAECGACGCKTLGRRTSSDWECSACGARYRLLGCDFLPLNAAAMRPKIPIATLEDGGS